MKSILMLLFLITGCRQAVNHDLILIGFWIPERLEWQSPPPETEIITQFVNATTLYFSSDGTFRMIKWILYKSSLDSLNVGVGDGFSVFEGKWKQLDQKKLLIQYRVIYRVIKKVGEKIPGEEITVTLSIIESNNNSLKLIMDNNTFVKTTRLTNFSKEFLLNPDWIKLK